MIEDSKTVYKAPALEKGLEILELLAEKQIPLSMSQIASELGRSKNEIFRMLSVLEQKRYLQKQDGNEKFTITNHLFDLGMKVPPTSTFIEFVFPIMHEIAAMSSQSCHISVRTNNSFVIIARVESPGPIGLAVRVGFSKKLIETNSGKVLLAWLPESEREQIVNQQVAYLPNKVSPEKMLAELDQFKQQIVVENKSPYMEGITDISAPITLGSDKNKVIAVIAIPYSSNRGAKLTLDETVSLLKEKALYISAKSTIFGGL